MILTDPTVFSVSINSVEATVLVGISTFIGTLNALFFKWLVSKFKYVENLVQTVEKNAYGLMDKHEENDQKRFEETLYRFEKIAVALAKLGSTNGTH